MSVISKNVWGVTWFKNASDQGGAQRFAINYRSGDEVVVHSQTKKNGRMWGCVSPEKLLELVQSDHGIYEVLTHFPQKCTSIWTRPAATPSTKRGQKSRLRGSSRTRSS